MTLPFNVNNASYRHDFLHHQLLEVLSLPDIDQPALWGRMSVQHMIEHLDWTFNVSMGRGEVCCGFSVGQQQKMKQFIYSNLATPPQFENPVLPAHPLPLRCVDLNAARVALSKVITAFFSYYLANPEAKHMHPLFGELGREDWERVHYKHGFHHLLQFGLISQESDF